MKKYRVNESEHFNLMSMYDKLNSLIIDAEENKEYEKINLLEKRLEEVNELLSYAPCIGSLVTWPQLKRIREIRDERNLMRYEKSIECGASEHDAGYAFM